jgi:hypothetical protein
MCEKKIRIQQENSYKINFPATPLYCTLSTYVTPKTISCNNQKNKQNTTTVWYEINPSLELSLLPYVEMYRSSTYFFCAPQLTTRTVLVGSWWPGGLGSYRLPRRWYYLTKHTSPNYRPWVMLPMYGLVRFYRRAICDARHHQSKNVPIRNMRDSDLLEVILP